VRFSAPPYFSDTVASWYTSSVPFFAVSPGTLCDIGHPGEGPPAVAVGRRSLSFDTRPDIWSRLVTIYDNTEVLRNSLAHRRLLVDPTSGAITGISRPGEPAPRSWTVHEQTAFCQVAVGAANGVIAGQVATRQEDQLRWALDQLTMHHGQPPFGPSAVSGLIPRVERRSPGPSGEVNVDFTRVHARARAAVEGVSHYDLELHLPDGRVLAGPLEDARRRPRSPSNETIAASVRGRTGRSAPAARLCPGCRRCPHGRSRGRSGG